ncbi:hypothetical protein LZX34_08900, partial [Campylobacter coli]|nr:hypothetical protein [Campylobacter coli]
NKVRVAKNSHEFVGENKDIEIGANQNTIIHKDEIRNVKGENKLLIEKSLTQTIEKEFFLNVHQNLSAHIQDNTSLKSNSMQTKVEEQYSLESDNSTFDFQTDCEVKAGNQILHQVGDTQIVTKGDCVIIKAGGVEVTIDSNGLVVRGGEIKVE